MHGLHAATGVWLPHAIQPGLRGREHALDPFVDTGGPQNVTGGGSGATNCTTGNDRSVEPGLFFSGNS